MTSNILSGGFPPKVPTYINKVIVVLLSLATTPQSPTKKIKNETMLLYKIDRKKLYHVIEDDIDI